MIQSRDYCMKLQLHTCRKHLNEKERNFFRENIIHGSALLVILHTSHDGILFATPSEADEQVGCRIVNSVGGLVDDSCLSEKWISFIHN
jgi:hypothetical protein